MHGFEPAMVRQLNRGAAFLIFGIYSSIGIASENAIPKQAAGDFLADGKDNDAAWITAPSYSLDYEISPGELQKTSIKTNAKIFHDGQFLYVLIQAMDGQPDKIRASQSVRDSITDNEDAVSLAFDPSGNDRRSINLRVNAAGTQSDYISSNYGDGSGNWNGEWQSAVGRNAFGYTVEYKIPFSSLQVQPGTNGEVNIKWNVTRQSGRDRRELVSIAPIDYRKICGYCQALAGSLTDVKPPEPELRLNPYLIASQNYARSNPTGKLEADKQQSDIGLDGVWKISPKDKLVFTINPDYAQIEADSIQFQVNQRFARSYGERRAFFNEDSGFYSGQLPLVYTRSMVDPDYGIQYMRRDGNFSLGAFYVGDAATSFILPSLENSRSIFLARPSENLVVRSTYKPNDAWLAGAMVTMRVGADGYSNRVLSANLKWTLGDRQSLQFQLANSDSENPEELQLANNLSRQQQGNAFSFNHNYSGKYYTASTSINAIQDNFRADLGRVNQVGLWTANHFSYWEYKPGKESVFEYLSTSFSLYKEQSLSGKLLSTDRYLAFDAGWKNNTYVGIGFNGGTQAYEDVEYSLQSVNVYAGFKPAEAFSFSLSASRGDTFDYAELQKVKDQSFSFDASYSAKSKFELAFSASRYQFYATAGTQTNGSFYLSSNYHLNLKHHLRFIGSYGAYRDLSQQNPSGFSNTSKAAQYQLSYQYKPTAFKYFIAGISSAADNSDTGSRLETNRVYAFSKLVWEF